MAKRRSKKRARSHHALAVYKPPAPMVVHTGGTGAVRTVARVPKAMVKQVERLENGAKKAKEALNSEPTRSTVGMLSAAGTGFVTRKIVKAAAKKVPFVANHQVGAHVGLGLIGVGVAIAGAMTKHKTLMHAGQHFTTWNLAVATVLDEQSTPTTAGTEGPFDKAGSPEDRVKRRRQLAQALAAQIQREDPESTQGSDSLEGHMEDLLEGFEDDVGSIDSALCGDTGALPLAVMALPQIVKAIPGLKALLSNEGKSKLADMAAKGETPGLNAATALEGFDPDSMDTGSKKSAMRRLRRADKKQRKAERNVRRQQAKEMVKSGELITVIENQNSRMQALEQRLEQMAAAPAASPAAQVIETYAPSPAEEQVLVIPSPEETASVLEGRFPAYNLVRFV